jgi:hypothetical protein
MGSRGQHGGPRPRAGRPKGTGHKRPQDVRRHRVALLFSDVELAELKALANERGLPIGTAAHEIVARALSRHRMLR